MITNFQLEDLASKHKIPLVGVFNKDTLPNFHRDGGWIINLQDSVDKDGKGLPGTHWTAFYCEGKHAAYFDSFGFPPPVQVQQFLEKKYNVVWSRKQIQNIVSEVCGWYCLFFIWFMGRNKLQFNKRFSKFLSLFSTDVEKNLTVLKRLLKPI
jgi:hypothetical protein